MDLIESYYAVARDLERQAAQFKHTAEMVAALADQMSEVRMRETREMNESSQGKSGEQS